MYISNYPLIAVAQHGSNFSIPRFKTLFISMRLSHSLSASVSVSLFSPHFPVLSFGFFENGARQFLYPSKT